MSFDWRTPVIAIDFDGCLCKDEHPKIGLPNWEVINEAKRLQKDGACLILWTCRGGKDLEDAVEACKSWGLTFDAVNENPQFRIDLFGGNDCRKIGADEYWDDRSVYMGTPGAFRNIRGATVRTFQREDIRAFIDNGLRPEIARAEALAAQDAGTFVPANSWRGIAILLKETLERMELLMALLDERNEAHSWYRDGYRDATQNAANWITEMVQSADQRAAEYDAAAAQGPQGDGPEGGDAT